MFRNSVVSGANSGSTGVENDISSTRGESGAADLAAGYSGWHAQARNCRAAAPLTARRAAGSACGLRVPLVALVRLGRPTFLADTALSVLSGVLGGLVVAAVVAAAGYPEWGETLLGFLVVFAFFYLVGLAIRAILHVGYEYVNHGLDPTGAPTRASFLRYSLPWMRFGAGSAGAAAVLALVLQDTGF